MVYNLFYRTDALPVTQPRVKVLKEMPISDLCTHTYTRYTQRVSELVGFNVPINRYTQNNRRRPPPAPCRRHHHHHHHSGQASGLPNGSKQMLNGLLKQYFYRSDAILDVHTTVLK